jgi:hypothetical protein
VSGARWRIGIRFPEQQLNDPARLNYGASASAGAEVLLLGPASDAYGASASVGNKMVLALGPVNLGTASSGDLPPALEVFGFRVFLRTVLLFTPVVLAVVGTLSLNCCGP